MTLHEFVILVVKASIILTVFGVALSAEFRDALYLLRHPGQLARSLIAMNVIMPGVAVILCASFNLHPAVKIALVALAVSPVPPLLPRKQLRIGGGASHVIGLFAATSLLAIIFVPATMALVGKVFGMELHMPAAATMKIILTTVLAPLVAGIVIKAAMPRTARWLKRPVMWLATVLLIGGALPVLFVAWPTIRSLIGNGTLAVIIAFTVIGLAVGHLLGGPDFNDRKVLALATSSRHPAVAIAIAHINFPEQNAAVAAVLLALLVGAIVAAPYLAWCKKHGSGMVHAGAPLT